jgi:UDP-N-acetylglucosamine transferase subunit ALG13
MIYATVGTMFLDFPRLIHKLDEIALITGEEIIVQRGLCKTIPKHCGHFDFKGRDEILKLQRAARVIIVHGGIGTSIEALDAGRPVIVVPRRKKFKEHLTDHQLDVAGAMERRGWARMIIDIDDLPQACAHPPAVPDSRIPARHRLIDAVRDTIERTAAQRL